MTAKFYMYATMSVSWRSILPTFYPEMISTVTDIDDHRDRHDVTALNLPTPLTDIVVLLQKALHNERQETCI